MRFLSFVVVTFLDVCRERGFLGRCPTLHPCSEASDPMWPSLRLSCQKTSSTTHLICTGNKFKATPPQLHPYQCCSPVIDTLQPGSYTAMACLLGGLKRVAAKLQYPCALPTISCPVVHCHSRSFCHDIQVTLLVQGNHFSTAPMTWEVVVVEDSDLNLDEKRLCHYEQDNETMRRCHAVVQFVSCL